MNKRDLVSAVTAATCMKRGLAEKAVETVLSAIRTNARRGVQLVGFGSFCVVKRRAKTGRNPQTGKIFTVAEHNVVKFRPGTEFTKQVNKRAKK